MDLSVNKAKVKDRTLLNELKKIKNVGDVVFKKRK